MEILPEIWFGDDIKIKDEIVVVYFCSVCCQDFEDYDEYRVHLEIHE